MLGEVEHGVGELGKDEDLLVGMFFGDEFVEFGGLVVLVGPPFPGELEHGEQPHRILAQMLGEVFGENIVPEPVKEVSMFQAQELVASRGFDGEILQRCRSGRG